MDKMEMALETRALLGCPFCGGEASVSTWGTESLWSHNQVTYTKVGCDECDVSLSSEPGFEVEAPAAWNTRAALTPAPLPDDVVPFAYFAFNSGWGVWEQVVDSAKGQPDVLAAYGETALASYASRLAVVEGERDAAITREQALLDRIGSVRRRVAKITGWDEAGEGIRDDDHLVDLINDVSRDADRATTAEARAEAAEKALEAIRYEAQREKGGLVHLRRCISAQCAILDRREDSHD